MKLFGLFFAPLRWALRTVALLGVVGVAVYFGLPHLIPTLNLPSLGDFAPSMRSYDEMAEEVLAANPIMVLEEAIPNDSLIHALTCKVTRVYGYEVVREDTSGGWWSSMVGNDWAATDYVEVREFIIQPILAVSTAQFRIVQEGSVFTVIFREAFLTNVNLLTEGRSLVYHSKNENIPAQEREMAKKMAEFSALHEIAGELRQLEDSTRLQDLATRGVASVIVPLLRGALGMHMGSQASQIDVRVQIEEINWTPTDETLWSPAEPPQTQGISSKVKFAHQANELPYIDNPQGVQRLIEQPLRVVE